MVRDNYKALIVVVCCWLASCVKDKPAAPARYTGNSNGRVYVVCEGNFGSGDASLYVYDPAGDSVFGDVYKGVNNQDLGDVFQSMTKVGQRFFLCVNNSDKVVVLNAGNLTIAGTIAVPKPRYMLAVSTTRAYVTSEYSRNVYVVNPQTLEVTDTVQLPHENTEGICLYDDHIIVCAWDTASNKVYKVAIASGEVVQDMQVAGYAPQESARDKEGMLWVLSGNRAHGQPCALTRLDPSTGDILASYRFPAKADALKPVFNMTKDTLYFIEADYYGGTTNNGIYRMGIHDSMLPVVPFVAAKAFQYFWALGIEPATGNIYAGDPKGFVQKGSVYVYRPDGTQVKKFDAGVGPGHFYFDE